MIYKVLNPKQWIETHAMIFKRKEQPATDPEHQDESPEI